jgi:hypothetical protein
VYDSEGCREGWSGACGEGLEWVVVSSVVRGVQ